MLRSTLYCLAVLVLPAPPALGAPAGCSLASADGQPHLVELYTSEGCDSCPPAERWISSLRKHADLIALEFHVDYWDTSDWRDPFSQHAFTLRQQALADRSNKGQIYTPQVWLDGRLWYNWPKGSPPAPVEGRRPSLRATISTVDPVAVDLEADAGASGGDLRMYAAVVENGLSEFVRGGENHGKTLAHDSVVRAFAGPFALPRASAQLELAAKVERKRAALVAFVEDAASGTIVQALRAPLGECVP